MPVDLIEEIRACRICESQLPLGPRPVFKVHPEARVIIVGQAPGTQVHASGISWDDQSRRRLRHWMDVDDVALILFASSPPLSPQSALAPAKSLV